MQPAVFLDRDNTIIHNDGDLGDPAQVRLIQGAAPAIASLCGLGYRTVVVTNQGGVARGKYTEADVEKVHERISELLRAAANGARIDRYAYCPYHPQGNLKQYRKEHPNRKPNPGMLLEAAEQMKLDLPQSWMVGDQLRDIEAGQAAGVRTVLVAPDGHTPDAADAVKPDFVAASLIEAVRLIASQPRPDGGDQAQRAEKGSKRWDAEAVARVQRPRSPRQPPPRRPGDDPEPTSPKRPTGQFRPWNAPPPREDGKRSGHGSVPGAGILSSLARGGEPDSGETGPPEATARGGTADAPAQSSAPVPPEADPDEAPPSEPAERTLRLILQELRAQRGAGREFNALSLFAMILQVGAIVCLLGALFMAGPDEAWLHLRWLGTGLMLQLGVIATLMFARMV